MQQDVSSHAKEAGPGNRLDSMAILDCSIDECDAKQDIVRM